MICTLIGHRGAGKSSLLQRWKIYDPQVQIFDLDLEIEKHQNMKVSDVFQNLGEPRFREIEREVFADLCKTQNVVIACGAGLDVSQMENSVRKIWVRRDLDKEGRIFLDRPRLDQNITPLSEFENRFQIRDPRYLKASDFIYTLPEGLKELDPEEKEVLLGSPKLNGTLTIIKEELKSKRNYQNVTYEWRDDILSLEDFLKLEKHLSHQDLLFSVRTDKAVPEIVKKMKMKIDWDLSRTLPKDLEVFYLSTHQDQIVQALNQLMPFENSKYHLKLCPLVKDWHELKRGYDWQQADPEKRNFLPRSEDGSWGWFRLFMKTKQKLNFFREGSGSSLDQPTVWEWLSHPTEMQRFSAVLGSPIQHSFSPVFHKSYFGPKGIPFYKIQVDQRLWHQAIKQLTEWGLSFSAVTSPLKVLAGDLVAKPALNTLVYDPARESWHGTNTDQVGLEKIFANLQTKKVAVWGGGGLLETMQKLVPAAAFYSARTGQNRVAQNKLMAAEILIWAAGDADISKVPSNWPLEKILDLSYTQNSPARELALSRRIPYQSGLELFELQAKAQQLFWDPYV